MTHNDAVRTLGRCDCPCHVPRDRSGGGKPLPVFCTCRTPQGYR